MTPTEIRLLLREGGYDPIPLRGKNPALMEKWQWQTLAGAEPRPNTNLGAVFPRREQHRGFVCTYSCV
jgi:hypothetical protein